MAKNQSLKWQSRKLELGLLALLTVLGIALFLTPSAVSQPGEVACTMEAKLCPDGSYVGRSGPKCEFAACPR